MHQRSTCRFQHKGAAAGVLLIIFASAALAVDTRTLVPASGTVQWEVNANWNPADYPNTPGSGGEGASVGDATGDRTLFTTQALNISQLNVTQSSAAVNRLELGGNLLMSQAGVSSMTNTSGSAANLVIDLNSYTLDLNDNGATFDGPATVLAEAGGLLISQVINYTSNASVTGENVTLRTTTPSNTGATILRGTFTSSTTIQFRGTNAAGNRFFFIDSGASSFANSMGYAEVGAPSGSPATILSMDLAASSQRFQLQNDFTIHPNAGLAFANNNVVNVIRVAGNFTDTNTTGGYSVAGSNNAIIFNGSPTTAGVVDIRRPDAVVNFAVGVSAADTGHVRLAHDLTTTGNMIVRTDSTFDAGGSTLSVTDLDAQNNAIFGWNFGTNDGLNAVNGTLTLNNFVFTMTRDSGWVQGRDLLLFTYGTLSGTPSFTLGDFDRAEYFTYDSFTTTGGEIWLNDVYLPEPASAAMLLVGALLLRRRRSSAM